MLRWLQRGLIGLVLICVGLSGWWWPESRGLNEAAERYEAGAARTEMLNRQFEAQLARDGLTIPGDQVALVQGKIAFANQLAEKRSFSWTRLLSELEDAVPPHVSIGSVKLDFQQSRIMLDGVARSLQDVNAFVRALQHQRAFQEAVLVKHEERKKPQGAAMAQVSGVNEGGGGAHIGFTLAVGYQAALMNLEALP